MTTPVIALYSMTYWGTCIGGILFLVAYGSVNLVDFILTKRAKKAKEIKEEIEARAEEKARREYQKEREELHYKVQKIKAWEKATNFKK